MISQSMHRKIPVANCASSLASNTYNNCYIGIRARKQPFIRSWESSDPPVTNARVVLHGADDNYLSRRRIRH